VVSSNDPLGNDENPFGGENPLGELAKLFNSLGLGSQGGDPWRQARQIAHTVAAEGSSEPNLDPLVRMAVEDLARVADLHIRQVPGVELDPSTVVKAVSRTEWTDRTLDAYRPFFERFGEAVSAASVGQIPADDPMALVMGQMFSSLGPVMVAASAGSMIGHLGQRALGQYDLPVPVPGNIVQVVPTSIDIAAAEWNVPLDELRLVVLLHELATHAVLSTPHVGRRLENLFIDFAAAFRPDVDRIGEQFGDITDFNQIQQLSESLGDPDVILSMMRSPAHDLLMPQLDALVAVVIGFVDFAVGRACTNLVPSHPRIREAMRARMSSVTPADRFMERLLGIEIDDTTLERGDAFIDGIVERVGDRGVVRLWADELDLPTAAEVDAPGLWLARIGLDPDLPGGTDMHVPDDLSELDDL
jgi:putative hydrolase